MSCIRGFTLRLQQVWILAQSARVEIGKMDRSFRALVMALALGGCASSGTQVTQDQVQSFKTGKSTYSEVVGALGAPSSVTSSSGGQKVAVYAYSAFSSRPQNFIPYIGPLVGGYDTKSSAVTFVFDARDVLVSYSSTQGGMGVDANLASTPAQR